MPRQRPLIGTTGRRRCGWCGRSVGSKVTLTWVSLMEKLTLMRSRSAALARMSASCRMMIPRFPVMRARWSTAVRHRLSRSAADFFAADLDDDRRLVEQVDVLVAAGGDHRN
ncbi:hypothetical protein IB277_14045 [Ensifer sp. ENS07]|uniref:hypothetical protein n=1 Tax=unclassified Ensifer TaxID=2633371 RepID=UPI00177ECC15|nr:MULTISPECIES: hypothetical protein [unclassified Ensifer]MBD9508077.1 hypothetical protein [Ensifer sp. ENS10]MBD9637427.1 hypothetical protein [Ensifer sp. ENS07]